MKTFGGYARVLARYRCRLVLAIAMAFVSAGGLGAGLVALVPVLRNILGDRAATLPDLARDANVWWASNAPAWLPPGVVSASIPGPWIDALPATRFSAVLAFVCGLAALTVLGASANFLHQYLSLTVTTNAVADVRRRSFHRVVRAPMASLLSRPGSDVVSRVINDTAVLGRGFQALTNKAVANITKGAVAFAAALVINWQLTVITVAVAPVLAAIIRKLGKRIRRATRDAMQGRAKLLGVAGEAIEGLRIMKAHATESHQLGRFTLHNRDVVRHELRARTARALSGPLLETVSIFAVGSYAVIAAKAIIDGVLDPSEFFGALIALALAGQALKPLNGVIQDIQTAEAAARRLEEIEAVPTEDARDRGKPRLPRHTESIEFDAVRFAYPTTRADGGAGARRCALDGVSLRIHAGQTVALVGPNGSGKTTLLSLVPRLFDPDEGAVRIDGVDVRTVALRGLRRQIGVVPQEVLIFAGTIAENIAHATRGLSRDAIEDAARRAHADAFVRELPGGYDAEVGERGVGLSGGQRQRLAIARAIARDPAILLLDEATSMIDAESEAAITEALRAFAAGRTSLIVAHRLSTVLHADTIVVMDEGRLVDAGGHDELLRRCPLYERLARDRLAPAGARTP